uniref:Uncharacterized protein n=1 Tax=Rhizophora mucronata TaxID=61149 RepID=A0A2P2P8J4_RHIMU
MSSPMGALIMPMIQSLETTLKAGAVPQVPQFRPSSMSQPPVPTTTVFVNKSLNGDSSPSLKQLVVKEARNVLKTEVTKSDQSKANDLVPSSVKPTEARVKSSTNGVAGDPLGDARSKVQEEICREFAAIMTAGTLSAGEAAALATRRVMQRYGNLNVAAMSHG